MTQGPIIETARLILRPPQQEDFEGWAEFYTDDENLRFIGGAQTRDNAWRFMATMAGSWALLGYGMFSVIEKDTGRCVGRVGPWRPAGEQGGWPGSEVGWGIARAAQGRGIAYEAAVASMDFAFDQLGWSEVIHCIAPDNAPSIALAKRLGSTTIVKSGNLLPAPFDHMHIDAYGQTKEQWKARKP